MRQKTLETKTHAAINNQNTVSSLDSPQQQGAGQVTIIADPPGTWRYDT
jgi:hypothetical protein